MKTRTVLFAMLGVTGTGMFTSLPAMGGEQQEVAKAGVVADGSRMRVGVAFVPMPLGRLAAGSGADTGFGGLSAFALMTTFDFVVHPNVFVGFAPSYTFHVAARGSDIDPSREFDIMLRFGYMTLVTPRLHAYGYVAPGYSFIAGAVQGAPSQGPVIGVHAGALFDLTPGLFLNAELGYQEGRQQGTYASVGNDLRASFVQIGGGVGVRI